MIHLNVVFHERVIRNILILKKGHQTKTKDIRWERNTLKSEKETENNKLKRIYRWKLIFTYSRGFLQKGGENILKLIRNKSNFLCCWIYLFKRINTRVFLFPFYGGCSAILEQIS